MCMCVCLEREICGCGNTKMMKMNEDYLTVSMCLLSCAIQMHLVFTARCYTERGCEIAGRVSVRSSVTFKYRDHIGWNSSKISSRPNSLWLMLGLTTGDLVQQEHPKIRVE